MTIPEDETIPCADSCMWTFVDGAVDDEEVEHGEDGDDVDVVECKLYGDGNDSKGDGPNI